MDFYKDYTTTQALGGLDDTVQLRVAADNVRTNLLPHLPPDRQAKILDVACGYGRYLKALLDLGYTHVEGVDLSAEQIEYAQQRLGLTCARRGDGLAQLEAHPATFDAILLLDILEHLPADATIAWLEAAFRALKTDGIVLVQVPNGLTPFPVHFHGDLTHQRAYSASMLEQSFRLAGIKNFTVLPTYDSPTRFVGTIRHFVWKYLLNPLCISLSKVAYGTVAGGVFTANVLGVGRKMLTSPPAALTERRPAEPGLHPHTASL